MTEGASNSKEEETNENISRLTHLQKMSFYWHYAEVIKKRN